MYFLLVLLNQGVKMYDLKEILIIDGFYIENL